MRMISRTVLVGIAALTLGGTAMAAVPESRVVRVTWPDGSVHVRHSGDVAPVMVSRPAGVAIMVDRPTILVVPVRHSMFPVMSLRQGIVRFDRVMAAIERRMDLAMRQAARLTAQAPGEQQRLRLVSGESVPPGTVSYSFVSTTSGGKTCSRSVRVIAIGPDQPAKVERASSGDCGPAADPAPAIGDEPKPATIDGRRTI